MLPASFKKTKIKEKNPLVTVIIPVHNEEKDIKACIKSVLNQDYKRIEIIVVDDGSTDKTGEIVRKYKQVKLLYQEHRGPGEARNLGARKAKGKILVLIDADMILFPDYVEKLVKPVIENKALGTIESIQYNIIESKMQECWGKTVRLRQLSGFNSMTVRGIAKNDFLQLGGFDRKYGYADDQTFYYKYGIKFLILKDVKCYHKTPKTFKGVYKQSRWIGSSSLHKWLDIPLINLVAVIFLYLLSPLAIFLLSIRQAIKINKLNLLFPYMFIFITARYLGTLAGYLRRILLRMNVR